MAPELELVLLIHPQHCLCSVITFLIIIIIIIIIIVAITEFRIQEVFVNVLAEERRCQLQTELQKYKYDTNA